MQFTPGSKRPTFNSKIYKRAKIKRNWFGDDGYVGKTTAILDLDGNFNLMCANPRAIRLLRRVQMTPRTDGKENKSRTNIAQSLARFKE